MRAPVYGVVAEFSRLETLIKAVKAVRAFRRFSSASDRGWSSGSWERS